MQSETEGAPAPKKVHIPHTREFGRRHQQIRSKKLKARRAYRKEHGCKRFRFSEIEVPPRELNDAGWEAARAVNAQRFFNYGEVFPETDWREKEDPSPRLAKTSVPQKQPRPKQVNRLQESKARQARRGEVEAQRKLRAALNERQRRAELKAKRKAREMEEAA